jgi:diacylglycerol kinase family enzyme
VKHHQTTAVCIISTNGKAIPAHADGEIFESEKFDITLVKDALKIPVDSF